MARPPKVTAREISLRLMADGPSSAADLAAALRVTRSTITRVLGGPGSDQWASMGATRRTRYALRRKIRDMSPVWPVFRIDPSGRAREWGTLEVYHGAWRMSWSGDGPVWAGHFSDPEGIWEGFPFFLGDVRPQGFLGRGVIRQLARAYRLPNDPRRWIDDDILLFLVMAGQDVPGDLVVGDESLRLALSLQMTPSPETTLAPGEAMARYPGMAARAASDPPPGSSAGGEQPKFLATLEDPGTGRRQVLVKFSPPMSQSSGLRWADLLAMEFHALAVLAEAGLAGTGHRLVDAGGRRFLESPRLDRTSGGGRSGVVSLEALHGSAVGGGPPDWTGRLLDLERAGLVDGAAVRDTRRLQAFGELIGNTDMHAGNLAFRMNDELPFALAPSYDMLPMLWAPGPQGELIERSFSPQAPLPASMEAWREMLDRARDFWTRVSGDPRVSRESAAKARGALATLARLARHFGGAA